MADGNLLGTTHPGIAALKAYRPGKPVDELTRELGITDIVKLASNENPRGPGPGVHAAIGNATELSRYPDGSGHALKQALAEQLGVESDQLTLGNGSNDVLDLAARVTLLPGAEAIVSEHAFVVYRLATACCGGTLIEVPALRYGADLEAMLAAISERTAIIFLANPNNPTGTWVSASDLEGFLALVPQRVWVVLDEAYFEYVTDPDYPDGVSMLDRHPNLIVTRTFSKIHALAALRVGYSITSPELADLLNRARQPFNVNSLALVAAEAALHDPRFVSDSRAQNLAGIQVLQTGLERLGLSVIPSAGNFLAFDVARDASSVYDALLRSGVIVRPIAEYGLPSHLRVTVGLPEENERFLEALRRVLNAGS